MGYQHIKIPSTGERITLNADSSLNVPDQPVIPYIEGDGIGVDITPVMIKVIDTAVAKAYDGARQISWMEIFTGEKGSSIRLQRTSRNKGDVVSPSQKNTRQKPIDRHNTFIIVAISHLYYGC